MIHLDIPTIIFIAAAICMPIALLLFLSWWQNRAERTLLWWSGCFLFSGAGLSLAVPRGHIPAILSIDLANSFVLFGVALGWAGARVFNGGRRPRIVWLLAGVAVWLVALHIPGVHDDLAPRIGIFSAIYLVFTLLIAFEYWRGRADGLSSRYSLIVSLLLVAGLYAGRVVISLTVPMATAIEDARPDILMSTFFMLPLIAAVANAILVIAVTKERAEAAQRRLAEIDPLTGVLNRGATLDQAGTALSAGSGAMLLFDLDRFKQINDRHGHPAGDKVLREFAAVAKHHLRQTDVFGRIGGEEFLAFLPGADKPRAMAAAERIRATFAKSDVRMNGQSIPATVSIGIAVTKGPIEDIDPVLIKADRALYSAKENGRDRVQFFVSRAA